MNKENPYDNEPVYYCKRCLSLKIKPVPFVTGQDYCGECGTTDVACAGIDEWRELYRKRYGHDYVMRRVRKWPYWCGEEVYEPL